MQSKVTLRRENGFPRQPFGQRAEFLGDLHLSQVTVHGRRLRALQLLGANCPRLYEPSLANLSTNVLRFIGFERTEEGAWVMQE